jgi:lipid A 4'-phosphatase
MAGSDIERDRRWWLLPTGALAVGLLLTIPFWLGDLDVRVAHAVQAWNDGQGGDQEDRWWWLVPYYLPTVLSLGFGLAAVGAVVGGLLRPQRGWLRPGIYLMLVMAVGIGLITNLVLKDHWGRPRPRDTVQFGGGWDYLAPWDKGTAGRGKSFPCGHATVPALGFAVWLLWRRRRPVLARWSLAGGAVLTAWVAAARMLAQAHWLSDVLWAVVVMIVVPALLHRLLLTAPETERGPPLLRPRWPVLAGGGAMAVALVCAVLLATPFFREFDVRSDRQAIGPGPWRLEVVADVAEVTIELRPGAAHTLAIDGEVQGFGMPGVKIQRRYVCGDGVARVELAVNGLLSEHSASLRLVVDPADLAAIDVRVGSGDVVVHGPQAVSHIAVAATTRAGAVRLPEGWTARF